MELDDRISDVSKTIFHFCQSKTANTADAEDLSQDILLELCRSVHDLRNEAAKLFDRKLLLPYNGSDLLPTTMFVLNR